MRAGGSRIRHLLPKRRRTLGVMEGAGIGERRIGWRICHPIRLMRITFNLRIRAVLVEIIIQSIILRALMLHPSKVRISHMGKVSKA